MQDNGIMYGVNGAYQLTYKDMVFLRPEARVVYGEVDYKNWRGADHRNNGIPSMIVEPRLLGGGNIHISPHFKLSPYLGVGFRYKWDDVSDMKSQANISGVKRINKTWYIPIGSRFTYNFNYQWFIQGMAEYDWFISGRQLSYAKERYPSPLVFKQKKGWGARGELLIGHHFDKVSVAFGPYMNYWKIEETKYVAYQWMSEWGEVFTGSAYEPKNITKEIGLKLNFIF
jgi:hypothetical protein